MEKDWKRHHFHHVSLAPTLAHLTKLQWETSQALNQVLVYHTAQSEPPGTPGPGAWPTKGLLLRAALSVI